MSILHIPGQPPPSEPPPSLLHEDQMPDGSVRLVHQVRQPNGEAAFLAFMADGTFMLRDAYGSMIMSNPAGDMLISPARAMVLSGKEIMLRNSLTHEAVSILPREPVSVEP